jgi:hypothetical protein
VNLGSLNLRLKNQNHKKGCEYHELMKGHDAMIIVPMELAQMLDSRYQRTQKKGHSQ